MSENISYHFKNIAQQLVQVLNWILQSNRHNINNFSTIVEPLKLHMKALYSAGREELQPGRLDKLFTLEERLTNGQLTASKLGESLLESVIQCFRDNWIPALNLCINSEVCLYHLSKLKSGMEQADMIFVYKKILNSVNFVLQSYSNKDKSTVMILCLNQIRNALPLLLLGIEKGCAMVWNYAVKCLEECFERMQNDACVKSDISFSEFLNLMDSALNMLDDCTMNAKDWIENSEDRVGKLKIVLDEILCHAISTGQVASTDKDIIFARSQTILKELESLKDKIASENTKEICLSADCLIDGLCSLERTVNATVLRLVLEISSGSDDPLRKLVDMCRPNEAKKSRKPEDLDNIIIELDVYMDKLMQIGSFAVSCSADIGRAMEIRSCLATFESLETELVPSAVALYTEYNIENKRSLRLFIDHWLQEIDKFHAVLFKIVDPSAYTEIVKEFISQKMRLINGQDNEVNVANLNEILKASRTLKGVIQATAKQDCPNDSNELMELLSNMIRAVDKCEKLKNKLATGMLGIAEIIISKIGDIIIAVDNLLSVLLKNVIDFEVDSFTDLSVRIPPPQTSFYKLCTVELDGTSMDTALTPLITKAQHLTKVSVLYNTPKRSVIKEKPIIQTPIMKSTVKNKRVATVMRSRCFRTTKTSEAVKAESSDMELTKLLDEISQMEDTFTFNDTLLPPKSSPFKRRHLLDLFSSWDSMLETPPMYLKTGMESSEQTTSNYSSKNVATPERLSDLRAVNDKIEELKMKLDDEAFF